ncbi:MAG TPA: hypothetical protein VMA36_05730 [Candidatus Limnocylindria bacterium]|jgi:hypothetical protein|nr:hypothetical protein [Candidatus Limnocylindria bacterium]
MRISRFRIPAALALLLAIPAVASASPVVLTTRHVVMFVDGNKQQSASAGPGADEYGVLSAVNDGTVLVFFADGGTTDVEAISPSMQSRTVKRFPRVQNAFVSPSTDGFVAYDPGSQLLRRYDLQGNGVGSPIAATGAQEALGIGNVVVVAGSGRLSVWDAGGHVRQEVILQGSSLVALGSDRFAVIDGPDRQVRIYDTNLDRKATISYGVRPLRKLAVGPNGELAVLSGTPGCVGSDSQVDLYDDPTNSQPRTQIRQNVATATALAVTADQIFVGNAGCRGETEGSLAVFGHDGATQGGLLNLGNPTGIVAFPPQGH